MQMPQYDPNAIGGVLASLALLFAIFPSTEPQQQTVTASLPGGLLADGDRDYTPDVSDNCPSGYNPVQMDRDGDGIGDVCDPDMDGDGVPQETITDRGLVLDNCLLVSNPYQADRDGDWIGDACDNCISVPNTMQADADRNGIGDVCELSATQ